MFQKLRRARLSHATVVAYLALFVALGGTSVAAVTLANNSVKSKHIAKGNVKRSDIGRNAVNSAKVANASLRAADFAAGQLPAGPKGDKGDTGQTGAQGVPGGLSSVVTRFATDTLEDGTASSITATCNAGEKLIGGGARMGNTNVDTADLRLTSSRPTSDAGGGSPGQGGPIVGWRVVTWNVAGGLNANIDVFAYAICAQ
jgi:hypothetical protein